MRGFLTERWNVMSHDFREIAREVRTTRGLEMLVLSGAWRRNPCWGDRLFDDCTDRWRGGRGGWCWVGSVEEEMERDVYGDEEGGEIHQDNVEAVGDTDVTSIRGLARTLKLEQRDARR